MAQAMGRYLLLNLEGGSYGAEGFVACQQLQSQAEYAILTMQRVLVVQSPGLRFLPILKWQLLLDNLILITRCAHEASWRGRRGWGGNLCICHAPLTQDLQGMIKCE